MSKVFVALILVSLLAAPLVALAAPVLTSELPLPDGRHLIATSQASSSKKWFIYVPGSSCALFPLAQSMWIRILTANLDSNVLVINKSGAAADGGCRFGEFSFASVRPTRIADINYVLHTRVPADAIITLIAESEGAYIAPDIALVDARVKKLILISAGTRSWIDEEISFVAPEQQAALKAYFDTDVIGHNSLTDFYHGWSYAQINSYNTRQTLTSLQALQMPTLMLNGELDHATWVQATTADMQTLLASHQHANLEFHLIPKVNHALGCDANDPSCDPASIANFEASLVQTFMSKP